MAGWRCFVAIPLPDGLRSALEAAVAGWRAEADGARLRWTDPAGWHLTLAFLGSVEPDLVPRLVDAIAGAAAAVQRHALRAGGLGAFPSPRRARVIWYGAGDPDGSAQHLADEVRRRLNAWVPQLAEEKPFRAHVTLARARDERGMDVSDWLQRHSAPGGVIPIDRVVLYRSHLGRGPAQYEALASAPVGSGGGGVLAEASARG